MSDPAPLAFYSEPEHQPFAIGDGPDGALLIHGFMGTPAEMRPLAERLGSQGVRAWGPLLPGFGPNVAQLGSMTRQHWLDEAFEAWTVVRQRSERAMLIGFSMGGAIALQLAATLRPDALILIAPFWRGSGWQFSLLPLARHIVPTVAPFARADFADPAVQKQLASIAPGIDLSDPATQRYLREQVQLPLAVLDELRILGKEAFRKAASITVPTLIVQGSQDDVVAPRLTRRLAERMGSAATYLEIPGDHACVGLGAAGAYGFDADIVAFWRQTAAATRETTPASIAV